MAAKSNKVFYIRIEVAAYCSVIFHIWYGEKVRDDSGDISDIFTRPATYVSLTRSLRLIVNLPYLIVGRLLHKAQMNVCISAIAYINRK